jgi:hypothetical protein
VTFSASYLGSVGTRGTGETHSAGRTCSPRCTRARAGNGSGRGSCSLRSLAGRFQVGGPLPGGPDSRIVGVGNRAPLSTRNRCGMCGRCEALGESDRRTPHMPNGEPEPCEVACTPRVGRSRPRTSRTHPGPWSRSTGCTPPRLAVPPSFRNGGARWGAGVRPLGPRADATAHSGPCTNLDNSTVSRIRPQRMSSCPPPYTERR